MASNIPILRTEGRAAAEPGTAGFCRHPDPAAHPRARLRLPLTTQVGMEFLRLFSGATPSSLQTAPNLLSAPPPPQTTKSTRLVGPQTRYAKFLRNGSKWVSAEMGKRNGCRPLTLLGFRYTLRCAERVYLEVHYEGWE